ncbi:MAG: hypothetical protein SF182_26840 [Deltaproteobacteria bacterium]|nr:hypothetical protein [Deltaproteobacteria bacterium]
MRTRALILLLVLGVGAAAWWSWRRPASAPAPVEPQAAAPEATPSGPPTFARWLTFEPPSVQQHGAAGDLYIDAMLGHQVFRFPPRGLHPQLARQLILDDDKLLLSSGKRLWTKELAHQPGLAGEFCYGHSTYCLRRLYDVSFAVDGQPLVVYDNQYGIERYPSHTIVQYQLGPVSIAERKFITWDDRAATTYAAASADGKPHTLTIEVIAGYLPVPGADASAPTHYPLLGAGNFQGVPLFLYLDAPGFTALDAPTVHLKRDIAVPAAGNTADVSVALRYDTVKRDSPETPLPSHLQQARAYDKWFADNVPYFDAPDMGFKKMWYYRWWVARFSMVDMQTADLRGYAFYEGKLGFDNPIGFAVPLQIKELTYARDPAFAFGQLDNSYRNRAPNGAVIDPPGSPYWNETYSHWIAAAAAELHRVHPLPPEHLKALLPAMADDVRAWMTAYDSDGDGLPERDRPRVTGYDLDILSYWYFDGTRLDPQADPPAMERADFAAFVYGNAVGVAELADAAGDTALAAEFRERAAKIRSAALAELWDDQTHFFYPQRAGDDARAPIRELHGFFPFTTDLAPNEPRYTAALAALIDPNDFWARYPPVITSLQHYKTWNWQMDGLTRNIAPHPISMGARTALEAIKHYDHHPVTAQHFMELMRRYNDLIYPGVHPSDATWRPNAHEYYSKWEPYSVSPRPKPSDISHDFHSMYISLVVEGVVGLTPRIDEQIELEPMAREWSYFALDGLRYRGHDLTIIWDRPDGDVRYQGRPEGFSLYIDDQLAFTRPDLAHVVYDPATRTVGLAEKDSPQMNTENYR